MPSTITETIGTPAGNPTLPDASTGVGAQSAATVPAPQPEMQRPTIDVTTLPTPDGPSASAGAVVADSVQARERALLLKLGVELNKLSLRLRPYADAAEQLESIILPAESFVEAPGALSPPSLSESMETISRLQSVIKEGLRKGGIATESYLSLQQAVLQIDGSAVSTLAGAVKQGTLDITDGLDAVTEDTRAVAAAEATNELKAAFCARYSGADLAVAMTHANQYVQDGNLCTLALRAVEERYGVVAKAETTVKAVQDSIETIIDLLTQCGELSLG